MRIYSIDPEPKWEKVCAPKEHGPNDRYDPIGIRRLSVPSGWIYQFETGCTVDDLGEIVGREWGESTFVPFATTPRPGESG